VASGLKFYYGAQNKENQRSDMIYDLKFEIMVKKVTIAVPQIEYKISKTNLIAFMNSKHNIKTILGVGEEKENIINYNTEDYLKYKERIRIVPAFDFKNFDPLLAEAYIHYFSVLIIKIINNSKEGLVQKLLSSFLKRINYNINFEGYEQVEVEKRRAFENRLSQILGYHKSIIVDKLPRSNLTRY